MNYSKSFVQVLVSSFNQTVLARCASEMFVNQFGTTYHDKLAPATDLAIYANQNPETYTNGVTVNTQDWIIARCILLRQEEMSLKEQPFWRRLFRRGRGE